MKFVLAGYGSRGDVEPCAVLGRELLRRGHDVRIAVPPNMFGLVESAGLTAVSYGPDSQQQLNTAAEYFVGNMKNPYSALPEVAERVTQVWVDKGTVLGSLAAEADVLVTPGAGPAGGTRAYGGLAGDPGLRRALPPGTAG
jgi:UDP:flavonoid glycosyltransferase YjiC (YdhE family)